MRKTLQHFPVRSLGIAVGAALALSGCAQPSLHTIAKHQHQMLAQAQVNRHALQWNNDGIYVSHQAVNYTPGTGSITLNSNHAPIGVTLSALLQKHGYSLFFAGSASPLTHITANIAGASFENAVQQLALSAGYCAIIHPNSRRVVIATHGTYYFRLPTALFGKSATYNVGGDAAAGGSSSSGSSSGGMGGDIGGSMGGSTGGSSSSGGSSITADFNISGKSHKSKVSSLKRNIQALLGAGTVTINQGTGLVAVTGGAQGLARVNAFMQEYVRSAGRTVSLHVAFLQVSLSNSMQYGINWSKIVQIAGNNALDFSFPNAAPVLNNSTTIGSSGASSSTSTTSGGSGSTSITYTGQSISSVVKALQSVTNTRVISAPYLSAQDGTPATIYSGQQLPYIGSVSSNVTGLSGTSSTGASFQYVLNGMSLSFTPDILNGRLVSLSIIPVLSEVNRFVDATVDGTQLQGPVQDLKLTYMHTTVPNGKTLIMGGADQMTGTDDNSETPGLGKIPVLGDLFKGINDQGKRSQLVILIHAQIHHAPDYNPLIGESL
ncbi:hypothetical protein HF673_11205 [Acidithiobacillus thiooxidans]|uniref:type II secretion system protein GspD n=1 Tax=Acidithiobacillus thiooxidans TaxID=930 RepID=UPI001C07CF21|nr:type II and III secretion system protein [Acidithiobacillus thiooxidans]MBU2836320.1 hypothetical protein [Acidithiobacillus thiooxidans]